MMSSGPHLDPLPVADLPELIRFAGTVHHGQAPAEEEVGWAVRRLDGRAFGVRDGSELIAVAATCSFELTVPGGRRLPAAGLTEVAVHPAHRGRGLLRRMAKAHLAEARRSGEPLSLLLASDGAIYGRFGYGVGTTRADWRIATTRAALRANDRSDGRVRAVRGAEASRLLPEVFDRHRRRQAGQLSRSAAWWEMHLADPDFIRGGAGELQQVVYERGDGVEGYASWRFTPSWDGAVPDHRATVVELITLTGGAADGLLRFFTRHGLCAEVGLQGRTIDDPIRWRLMDPRQFRLDAYWDFLWVRLVDVAAALGARGYGGDDTLVLEVVDDTLAEAGGRFMLDACETGASCRLTAAPADITLTASDLASCYLGATGFVPLGRAGRLQEQTPGSVQRADKLFRTTSSPWCSTQF